MTARRVVLSWSSGKDSAWTLEVLRSRLDVEVAALLTTVNETHERVAMHSSGLRAHVVCIDPCGERSEFHTFFHDGPMFTRPVEIRIGERVERDGFAWCDLLPACPTATD